MTRTIIPNQLARASHLLALHVFIASLLCMSGLAFAQDTEPVEPENPGEVPRGFAGIELGMTRESIEELLADSRYFIFSGQPDVSFEPARFQQLFEAEGAGFVDRGIFQFVDGQLYSLTLLVSQRRMDHYSLYTSFVEQYGQPVRLNPSESVWERGGYRLSLERPLTVRYLDLEQFNEIQSNTGIEESLEQISRDTFLDQF